MSIPKQRLNRVGIAAWPDDAGGAGIPDAPFDGSQYVRRNGLWVPVVETFGLGTLLTPAMAGNTTPAPFVASASSIFDGNYLPYRAFDQMQYNSIDQNDSWASGLTFNSSGNGNEWIMIDLGQARMLTDYILRPRGYPYWSLIDYRRGFPINFEIRASTDGTLNPDGSLQSYTVADTQSNLPLPNAPFQPYHFALSSPISARFIEMRLTRVWTDRAQEAATVGQLQYYSSLNQ